MLKKHLPWLVSPLGWYLMAWCVIVKGPCRGKDCDYWTRVRIRKMPIDQIVDEIRSSLSQCHDGCCQSTENALKQYWTAVGIRDMKRLCQEEPDLCDKIRQVEDEVCSFTGPSSG
ncbi:MAG: hypothetical protein C4K49_09580 [Candidatus Thorarchaeota archaeon]|nr:MAG: hypothetical protein C4K49_09580 [Candidatus Thorarchaeota archaeon]